MKLSQLLVRLSNLFALSQTLLEPFGIQSGILKSLNDVPFFPILKSLRFKCIHPTFEFNILTICFIPDQIIQQMKTKFKSTVKGKRMLGNGGSNILEDMVHRIIGKPNANRLLEFVTLTLPMLRNPRWIAELPLESTHQVIERACRLSNMRQSHLQAMEAEIFTDWQRGLTTAVDSVMQGDRAAIAACYRFIIRNTRNDQYQA